MSRFNDDFGKTLREIRTIRSMTQGQLADEVGRILETTISVKTVSAWERGERSASAEQLKAIAEALRCSLASLCSARASEHPGKRRERFNEEGASLPVDEKEILYHIMVEWDGDRRALMQLAALYTALPKQDRYCVVATALGLYREAVEIGVAANIPQCDVEYVKMQWGKLHAEK